MLLDNYQKFMDQVFEKLNALGIHTSEIKIDHIGYQADSSEDYDSKCSDLADTAEKISENIVGGRRVGIFKVNEELNHNQQRFDVIEVIEPKEGQKVNSAWGHVEFLVDIPLEDFMERYSDLDWDVSALNRDEFPMLILKLGDGIRVKFPRRGALEEAERLG